MLRNKKESSAILEAGVEERLVRGPVLLDRSDGSFPQCTFTRPSLASGTYFLLGGHMEGEEKHARVCIESVAFPTVDMSCDHTFHIYHFIFNSFEESCPSA